MNNRQQGDSGNAPAYMADRSRISGGFAGYFTLERTMYRAIVITLLFVSALANAQELKPLPTDLSQVPNIGIEKADAIKFLDRVVEFTERKEDNGLTLLAGTAANGKIRVAYKLVDTKVVAALIAVPDASQKELGPLKSGMLIRFMENLVPERDWNDPRQSGLLGEAIGRLSKGDLPALSQTIGEKLIYVVRDAKASQIRFGVMNVIMRTEPVDIGRF